MSTVQAAISPLPRPYVPPAPAPANDVRPDDSASPAFTVPDAATPDPARPPADAKSAKPDTNTAAPASTDRGAATAKPPGEKSTTTSRAQTPGRAAANDDTDKADAAPKGVAPASALALTLLAGGAATAASGDGKAVTGDKDETKTSDQDGKTVPADATLALVATPIVPTVTGQVAPIAIPVSGGQPQQPGTASTPDGAIGKLGATATATATAPATAPSTPVVAATQALATADAELAAAAEALAASLPAEGGAASGSAKPAAPHGKAATAARSAVAASGTQDGVATDADAAPSTAGVKSIAGQATSSGSTEVARHVGLTLQDGEAGRSGQPASAAVGAASGDPAPLASSDPAASVPSFGQLVAAPTEAERAGVGQAAAGTTAPSGAAATTVVSGVAIGNVPVEIGVRSLSGSSHFEIRLDPVELGRIDVKLDIDATGSVRAHLLVDRPETLAFLQRDSSHLQRAFEQAGLTATSDGVALSLRQGSTDTGGGGSGRGGTPDDGASGRAQAANRSAEPDTLDTASASLATRRYLWSRPSGVDVRI